MLNPDVVDAILDEFGVVGEHRHVGLVAAGQEGVEVPLAAGNVEGCPHALGRGLLVA